MLHISSVGKGYREKKDQGEVCVGREVYYFRWGGEGR